MSSSLFPSSDNCPLLLQCPCANQKSLLHPSSHTPVQSYITLIWIITLVSKQVKKVTNTYLSKESLFSHLSIKSAISFILLI